MITSGCMVRLGSIAEDQTAARTFTVRPHDDVTDPTISSATHTISSAGTKKGREVRVRRRIRIQPGDLVFSRLHTQNGSFAFSTDSYEATGTFVPLRVRDDVVERRFLYWALHKFVPHLSTADTVGRETYKTEDILNLQLPYPKRDIQRRIAELLDNIMELRELGNQCDRRTQEVVPALFHQMFGASWQMEDHNPSLTLADMGKIVTGNTPPRINPELYGNFIEWVKTDNIDRKRGIVRPAAEQLSENGARRGRIVPTGTVLITCIAGGIDRIGDTAVTDREVAINQQINAIIPNHNVDSIFLWQLIRSMKPIIQRRAAGVMTRIINKSSLGKLPAICPPISYQRKFSAQVSEHLKLQDLQASARRLLDDLFHSVLHRAFDGKQ